MTVYVNGYGELYREACIREKFFTAGCNKQYAVCMQFAEHIGELKKEVNAMKKEMMLVNLIAMTYICSDTDSITYTHVANALTELFK